MVPDPLRSGGWNSYGYSYNNPVRFIDPSGRCGEIYTGNIDMNASINQRCYELAEGFTNELVNHGQYPLREDGSLANLSDYNVHVLEALYATSAAYGHNAKVKFPNPKMVPLNQPFQVTETFMGYTDLFWLDVISGGANLCGFVGGVGFSISGFPEVGVPVFLAGEGISYGTDLFTIAYISQTRGLSEVKEEVWEQLREQGGEKGLEVALIGLRNLKILKEAIGAPAPSIFGLPFDLAGLRLESQASYEIRVVPNSQ